MKQTKSIKNLIADEIVRFFKAFRISAIIGCVVILVNFFVVNQAHRCFNLDLTGVKVDTTIFEGATDIDGSIYLVDGEIRILYKEFDCGNPFNEEIYRKYYYSWLDYPSSSSTNELRERIRESSKSWFVDRLSESAGLGLVAFLAIPIIVSFFSFFSRLIYKIFIKSKNWVDKHKTRLP